MKNPEKITERVRKTSESISETTKRIKELHDTITNKNKSTDALGLRPKDDDGASHDKLNLL